MIICWYKTIVYSIISLLSSSDYISIQLVILNGIISLLSSDKLVKVYILYLRVLQILLTLCFVVWNIYLFYILFELLLLPIFYTIIYGGQTQDKIYTGYKFLYFTITFSILWLIQLLSIIYLVNNDINIITHIPYITIVSILFLLSILLKVPLPPLHIWLNDTHTASPVSSSILLAGTVLKVSCFALINYYIFIYTNAIYYYNNILLILIVIGVLYTSLAAIRQSDYKRYIAYTSVPHMNVCILPIMVYNQYYNNSVFTTIIIMCISHGLISGYLFYHVNELYSRTNTKVLLYLRGISIMSPILSIFALCFHIFNFSFPPAISWYAEYYIFINSISNHPYITIVVAISIILSLIYTILVYYRVYFSSFISYILYTSDSNIINIYFSIMYLFLSIIVIFIISIL